LKKELEKDFRKIIFIVVVTDLRFCKENFTVEAIFLRKNIEISILTFSFEGI